HRGGARGRRAPDQGSGIAMPPAARPGMTQTMTLQTGKIPVPDLTEVQAKAELKRLAAEIGAHDKRYYQEDAPTVSDATYDALRRRNEEIEARFPELVREDSPSRRVGAQPSHKFPNLRHSLAILSFGNPFS